MQNAYKKDEENMQFYQNWQSIRVKKEYLEKLKPIAEANERSVTQHINWLLKQEIEKNG